MLQLSHETETLARRVAVVLGRKPDDLIRGILEREARELGMSEDRERVRKATAEELLDFGRRASRLPLLDDRPIQQIIDEINEL